MLHTTFSELKKYTSVLPNGDRVCEALAALRSAPFAKGRTDVLGDALFVNSVEYDTKSLDASVLEVHKDYIDVMLILEGEETIAVCPTEGAGEVVKEYDPAIEAALYKIPERLSLEYMKKDDVILLFPGECHAPGVDTSLSHKVRKLIAKVRV